MRCHVASREWYLSAPQALPRGEQGAAVCVLFVPPPSPPRRRGSSLLLIPLSSSSRRFLPPVSSVENASWLAASLLATIHIFLLLPLICLDRLGGIVGPSWSVLAPSCLFRRCRVNALDTILGHFWCLGYHVGPSWGYLGGSCCLTYSRRSVSRLVLKPSWAVLGPVLGKRETEGPNASNNTATN